MRTARPPALSPAPTGADLDRLFRTAVYQVFAADGALQLRLDSEHPEVAALLTSHGVASAALLTAWNPQAHQHAAAANRQRQQQLCDWLRAHACAWLDAEGAAADRSWVEPSVLVLGLRADTAAELANRFDQLAWIELDASGRATLRYCARFEDNPPPCRSS